MSSQQEQAAVQAAADGVASSYTLIASFALLAYDSLLTLSEEVPYIWQKKWKLGTSFYLLARYASILHFLIYVILSFADSTPLPHIRTCNATFHFSEALFTPPLVGVQGLFLLRAYAVTDHKRLVLAVLSILSVSAIGLDLASGVLDNCDLASAQDHTFLIFDDVTTIAIVLFDTIVVVVTLVGTLGTWRVYKRSSWNGMTLTHVLAEQSLMRFGFVLTLTVTNVILPLVLRPTLFGILGPIQDSLSTIIICRFHLELQKRNAHRNSNISQDLATISVGSVRAASQRMHDAVMAEFGGSLVDGNAEAEAVEDEIDLEEFQARPQSTGITEG